MKAGEDEKRLEENCEDRREVAKCLLDGLFRDRLFLSASSTAVVLQVSARTLARHVAAGNIDYVKTGLGNCRSRRVFTRVQIEAFIDASNRRVSMNIPVQNLQDATEQAVRAHLQKKLRRRGS